MCVIVQDFVFIGQTVAEMLQFFNFSKWLSSVILDSLCACLDTHNEYLVVFITVQNFVEIDAIFDNMQVLIINDFGLKIAYACPKWRFFLGGGFTT